MQTIMELSASDLGRAIDVGKLDPIEILEAYLNAIKSSPEAEQIYTSITKERALAEALEASSRAKSGQRLSLLDGVPISWKDLFDTAGYATEAGSALLAGRVPEKDARCLSDATAKGLVCLGKTHMSELAFSGLGFNPITGTPPCINFSGSVPGGSSSGAGASVAYGLAPSAVGSDTGGSVRIPAAWNDLVGLKTTSGLISLEGVVPLCPSFDTVGPLTKSVEDSANLFSVLTSASPIDLASCDVSGRRLAILKSDLFDVTRDAPGAAFEKSVNLLSKAGAEISEIRVNFLSDANDISGSLFASEAYGTWKTKIEASPNLMFPEILARFRSGADVKAADFVKNWQTLSLYRSQFWEMTRGFDALICPTAPILPPNLEKLFHDKDYYISENLLSLRYTRIANLMGLCALTLPTGDPSCGLMMLAAPFTEKRLLRLALAAERAFK